MTMQSQPTENIEPVLDRMTRQHSAHERNTANRILSEARRAWPGKVEEQWWRWIAETSSSLGIRAKTLDCELPAAVRLVRDGAQLISHHDGRWLVATPTGTRNVTIFTLADGVESETQGAAASVESALEAFVEGGVVRCVVLAPSPVTASSEQPTQLSPWERLWLLLKPEFSDIWIVIVFAFVVAMLMLATPMAVEALVNTVAFGRFLQPILVLAFILLTFLGFQGAIRALQTYVVEIIQRRLFARVAGDLAYRLPRVRRELGDSEHGPELVNRFFDVVTVQKVAAQLLLDGLGLVLSTLIGMAVLGFYHPWLLGFDFFLLISIGMIIFVLGRGAVASAIKESKHKYYMAAWLEDIAGCPIAFHGDGGAEYAMERADQLIHQYLVARKRHFRIVIRQVLFALGLQAVASTVLLGLGGWLVVSGELTLGQLVAAELIVTVIVGAFAKFGKHMESFYDLLASVDKLGILFDLELEREDGMLVLENSESLAVRLEEVAYRWPGGVEAVDSLTLDVPPGGRLAVLGPSGSGKSTLLDLLYGVRRPSDGRILVNGVQPSDLRPDILRRHIGLARPGEVFHATVEENVHMHREGVASQQVRRALDGVGILPAVVRLADGFDAMLTSGGSPLSNQQSELLSVARASVARPGLLLIDGNLDRLSGAELEHAIQYLLDDSQPWTVIVATSREDVAERFGQRIVLKDLVAPT